jgi:hypothetical protein
MAARPSDVTNSGAPQGERHPVAQSAGRTASLSDGDDVDERREASTRIGDVAARHRAAAGAASSVPRALRSRPGRHPLPSSSSSRAALRLPNRGRAAVRIVP